MTSTLTEIQLMNNGFSVKKPFGSTPKMFTWDEIQNVRFSDDYTKIIFDKSEKLNILNNDNIGWYEFIQNVPSKYLDFDFNYVRNLIDSLNPCGVCGIIAVKDDICIVCESIPWNVEMSENQSEYIKSKQLEFYSPMIKEGIKIKKYAKPEHGFKADKNWVLYI